MLCEIPIPEGYEFVAFRPAKSGEIAFDGYCKARRLDYDTAFACIIICEAWEPPAFLPDGWIAMDLSAMWYWYADEPELGSESWHAISVGCIELDHRLIWTRPNVTDWKNSKRKIERKC